MYVVRESETIKLDRADNNYRASCVIQVLGSTFIILTYLEPNNIASNDHPNALD